MMWASSSARTLRWCARWRRRRARKMTAFRSVSPCWRRVSAWPPRPTESRADRLTSLRLTDHGHLYFLNCGGITSRVNARLEATQRLGHGPSQNRRFDSSYLFLGSGGMAGLQSLSKDKFNPLDRLEQIAHGHEWFF